MKHSVGQLLTEYFIKENEIDTTKEYEIVEIPARKLIKYNRFDLMAKWLYIDAKEKGLSSDYAYNVYFDNINAFSCGLFFEPGSKEKTSFQKYVDDMNKLVDDIKSNGFNKSKSLIPVGENDDVMDGAHRVSAAAFFDKTVSIIRFPDTKRAYSYDYSYFRKYMMSDVSLGYMAIQYVHLKTNCYMACLWPKVDFGRTNEVEDKFRSIGNIVYSQDIYLTYQGMCNLMIQVYGHQAWTGTIEDHFEGVRGKVDACYEKGQPIRTYLFEAENLDSVIEIKRQIREIFQIENHSIHISDNWNETLDMVEMLYNRNSVDFLNRAEPYIYKNIFTKLKVIKKWINENQYDKSRFLLGFDSVMEVCGIKPVFNLEYVTDYENINNTNNDQINNYSNRFMQYHLSVLDMLYNPENYFYFEGMKFIVPKLLCEMKMNYGGKKEIRDVKLLTEFMNKSLDIPPKYRFEIIDMIHRYQIEHHIYGSGTWSYAQYKAYIRNDKMAKVKSVVKKKLGSIFQYSTHRKRNSI